MELSKYRNKKVVIISADGTVASGVVDFYVQPNDNEGQEAIALINGEWFNETDIKSIALAD